jgi:hypothetical protein
MPEPGTRVRMVAGPFWSLYGSVGTVWPMPDARQARRYDLYAAFPNPHKEGIMLRLYLHAHEIEVLP